jgi:hypothetical protein
LYFHYFFTRLEAEEARLLIRQRRPLFQALYFSSALLCTGCIASYMAYHCLSIERELRNGLLRASIGAAVAWLAFFLCRSFERFFAEWMWIAVSVGLARSMEAQLNPLSRDKVAVVLLLLSLAMVLLIRRLARQAEGQVVLRALAEQRAQLARFMGMGRSRSRSNLAHQHGSKASMRSLSVST